MILIRDNVEKFEDDPKRIEELKAEGFREVITDDGKSKRKRSRKTAKSDSE